MRIELTAEDHPSVRVMANLGGCCTPPANHRHHHHHQHSLIPSSLLLPVCRFFFRDPQHNPWKGRLGRGRRMIVVAGLSAGDGGGGDGRASRASYLDLLHAAAARAASIRFRESHRPDPLFIDLYAGCLLPTGVAVENGAKEQYPPSMASSSPCHFTLATKFIDDKLLSLVGGADEIKQIVLLTDGFDTRPYRLNWPPRTLIFDISPESVFKVALRRLECTVYLPDEINHI